MSTLLACMIWQLDADSACMHRSAERTQTCSVHWRPGSSTMAQGQRPAACLPCPEQLGRQERQARTRRQTLRWTSPPWLLLSQGRLRVLQVQLTDLPWVLILATQVFLSPICTTVLSHTATKSSFTSTHDHPERKHTNAKTTTGNSHSRQVKCCVSRRPCHGCAGASRSPLGCASGTAAHPLSQGLPCSG